VCCHSISYFFVTLIGSNFPAAIFGVILSFVLAFIGFSKHKKYKAIEEAEAAKGRRRKSASANLRRGMALCLFPSLALPLTTTTAKSARIFFPQFIRKATV
jgi:hypothetical protein